MENLKPLDHLMKFDGLSEAEKITGKNYKEDASTAWLGFGLHYEAGKKRDILLMRNDDTLFQNTVSEYIRKAQSIGFELIYSEDIIYIPDYGEKIPKAEKYFIFFLSRYGILLTFDTYDKTSVNGASIYYNWSPASNRYSNFTSSGGFRSNPGTKELAFFEDDMITPYVIPDFPVIPKYDPYNTSWEQFQTIIRPIEEKRDEMLQQALNSGKHTLWSGNHDAREGLKYKIGQLLQFGKFYPYWHDCAFPWLVSYADHKNSTNKFGDFGDLYNLTRLRMKHFPEQVLKQIGPFKN